MDHLSLILTHVKSSWAIPLRPGVTIGFEMKQVKMAVADRTMDREGCLII
jgi:hypothetical protein